jgi:hypothetical protein
MIGQGGRYGTPRDQFGMNRGKQYIDWEIKKYRSYLLSVYSSLNTLRQAKMELPGAPDRATRIACARMRGQSSA